MADNTTTSPTETLEYRAEVKQLLDILAHSLYTDREVFLRELISNASDALNRVQFEMLTNHDVVDPEAELAIRITVDEEAKTITISDTGIGMNREEMVQNLGTIAHSGARTFLQNAGESKSTLEEIIGQFGVGFYSVFMVADEVTVTSRSYRQEDEACTWQSSGDSRFTLATADKQSRGTEIFIKLKEDAARVWRPLAAGERDQEAFGLRLIPDLRSGQRGRGQDGQPPHGPVAAVAVERGGGTVRRVL